MDYLTEINNLLKGMSTDQLKGALCTLTTERDNRYKSDRIRQRYYLYSRNGIYYAKFANDNKALSTRARSRQAAIKWADSHLLDHIQKSTNGEFHQLILEYYRENSKYQKYDIQHSTDISDFGRRVAERSMARISAMLPTVKRYADLDKEKISYLREKFLDTGLAAHTVNVYIGYLRKIYTYLYDTGKIEVDPFKEIKSLHERKRKRLCLDIRPFKNSLPLPFNNKVELKMSLLGTIAIQTGMRKSELFRMTSNDIIKTDDGYWLKVNGTKTANALRVIPITARLKELIELLCTLDFQKNQQKFVENTVYFFARFANVSLEQLKADNITFHSFRKMYRGLLSQGNLNIDKILYCMGHANDNAQSNDVKRLYLIPEKSDRALEHKLVCGALEYVENMDFDISQLNRFSE